MQFFIRWSKEEHSFNRRLLACLPAGVLFVGLIPWALLRGLPRLEGLLGLPDMNLGRAGLISGVILIVVGGPIGMWTVIDQFVRASGTPLPMLPTRRLLTDGPYAWSRNPMVFGTLCAYVGVALLASSWSAVVGVLLFAIFLIGYLKLIEERELAARFGEEYRAYKKRTSFLIPWPHKRG